MIGIQGPAGIRPRTLIFTHLRAAEPVNLEMCTRLWQLCDPVFDEGRPFERRLSIAEEGTRLPDVPLTAMDDRVFSWTGAIDDDTPPPGLARQMPYPYQITALERGFCGFGSNRIILGGGNLDFCLFKTFESLIRLKARQNEPLEAAIPLALTYWSGSIESPIEYILRPNHYTRHLEHQYRRGTIGNYSVTIDDNIVDLRSGNGPAIELKWYTVLKSMFTSPFFPEIRDQAVLERVFGRFKLVKEA